MSIGPFLHTLRGLKFFCVYIIVVFAGQSSAKFTYNSSFAGEWLDVQNIPILWEEYGMSKANYSPKEPDDFAYYDCFDEASLEYQIPISLILAVAQTESSFQATAVGPYLPHRPKSRALGIMQILWPATANELGFSRREDLFEPCPNIKAGSKYLAGLVDYYDGDYHLALAAYNGGMSNIDKSMNRRGRVYDAVMGYSNTVYNNLVGNILNRSSEQKGDTSKRQQRKRRKVIKTVGSIRVADRYMKSLKRRIPSLDMSTRENSSGKGELLVHFLDSDHLNKIKRRVKQRAGFTIK